MFDALKDWRGWLADWPLYVAGVTGMVAMIVALTAGSAVAAALSGSFLLILLVHSIRKDASGG
jgi:hypothetical protein